MELDSESESGYSEACTEENAKMFGEFDEEFQFEKKEKRFQEMTFLMGCLKNHFIFYNLSESQLENVAKKMFYCFVPCDTFVFKEGNKSTWFFIIEKGMMHAISDGKVKKQLRVGDGFGEIALLYKTQRNFSVKACESCCLWGIDRNTFRKAVQQIIIKEYQQNKMFMENVRFFRYLSNPHKDTVAGSLIIQNFLKGQTIVSQGDPGSSFYIIKSGQASVWKGNTLIGKLGRADCFGEQSLYYNTVRQLTVKAEGDLACLFLSRQTLAKVLGDQIFVVTFRNFIRWAIQKSNYLSKLNSEEIEKIIDLMKISTYKAGSIVIKKAKNGNYPTIQKVIIVIEGAIKKSKNINTLAVRSQIYGEDFLLQTKNKGRYDDDIIMESNGILAEISADLVKDIIKGEIDTIIRRREMIKEQNIRQSTMRKQKKEISDLHDLIVLKELKHGSYGPTLLVACSHHTRSQEFYLLKCAEKGQIQNHLMFKYICNEIYLQKNLNHPLIAEGYKALEDEALFYSLVQFVQGEELYEVIREIGLLSSQDAQFYTACIIMIIQYLYENNVFLRDIKPENFIVDMCGYPILIDMVSARLNNEKSCRQKTFTMIGTPHYMAPEIIMNKGHNFCASLYSLGITLYQFLCGYVPFASNKQDPLEIYDDILNSQLTFPKSLKDNKAKKLIEQLLNKYDPEYRLGGPDFRSLKHHHWFEDINWNLLYQKKVNSPTYQRNLNVEECPNQLAKFMKHAKNAQQYLNEKFPQRSLSEQEEEDGDG